MFKTQSGREITYFGEDYGNEIKRNTEKNSNKINTLMNCLNYC